MHHSFVAVHCIVADFAIGNDQFDDDAWWDVVLDYDLCNVVEPILIDVTLEPWHLWLKAWLNAEAEAIGGQD